MEHSNLIISVQCNGFFPDASHETGIQAHDEIGIGALAENRILYTIFVERGLFQTTYIWYFPCRPDFILSTYPSICLFLLSADWVSKGILNLRNLLLSTQLLVEIPWLIHEMQDTLWNKILFTWLITWFTARHWDTITPELLATWKDSSRRKGIYITLLCAWVH